MSIQKKSLISTLKTAKKANVASAHEVDAKGSKVASMRMQHAKSTVSAKGAHSLRSVHAKGSIVSAKNVSAKGTKSLRAVQAKSVSAKSVSAKSFN